MTRDNMTNKSFGTSSISHRKFVLGAAAAPLAQSALSSASGTAAVQDKTTITFWTHTHPPMVDLNKILIEQFQEQNPDIEIRYNVIPNNEFATKMLTSMGTGTGPDVINMDDNWCCVPHFAHRPDRRCPVYGTRRHVKYGPSLDSRNRREFRECGL